MRRLSVMMRQPAACEGSRETCSCASRAGERPSAKKWKESNGWVGKTFRPTEPTRLILRVARHCGVKLLKTICVVFRILFGR